MSQEPRTQAERIGALRQFGYTEREAGFLCLAALHGGYFVRRQYARFLGKESGGTVAALVQKVLASEHAKASTYADKTHVYHLCTRPFYQALGQVDNRNRRERQPLSIKNRLMGLDFVLAHPDNTYLATEQEKVDYFSGALKITASVLPTKLYHAQEDGRFTARYFVDKYPLFLPKGAVNGTPAEVSFCFVDEGAQTVSHFETYLDRYRPLLTALSQFRVVYVAAQPVLFQAAGRSFQDFLRELIQTPEGVNEATALQMLAYFRARYLFETGDFSSFDRVKLIRLREQRREFSSPRDEGLYARWRVGGEPAVRQVLAPKTITTTTVSGSFSTCLLEHNYDLFGSLTAF